MTMQPFTTLVSSAALLPADDIDTDQIIPARFLTTTEREGLGAHLFADKKFDGAGARILVAGRNFGCGSSREHAAWALLDAGFRAVVAVSFSDIFTANALKNGLLPVALDQEAHATVVAAVQGDSRVQLTIDLVAQTIQMPPGFRAAFAIDPYAKHCLVEGIDQLGYLLEAHAEILAFEQRRSGTSAPR